MNFDETQPSTSAVEKHAEEIWLLENHSTSGNGQDIIPGIESDAEKVTR